MSSFPSNFDLKPSIYSADLYLVSKLNDTKAFHNPALIKEEIMTTLRNLNLAYIDMYIIHCPEGTVFAGEVFADTWNQMEMLVVNTNVQTPPT